MTGTASSAGAGVGEATAALTAERFEAVRGQPLAVTTLDGGPATSLNVVAVDRLPHGLREGGAFSVLLEGPSEAALAQGLYQVELASGATAEPAVLFLVPVLRDGDVMQYEVIFT